MAAQMMRMRTPRHEDDDYPRTCEDCSRFFRCECPDSGWCDWMEMCVERSTSYEAAPCRVEEARRRTMRVPAAVSD